MRSEMTSASSQSNPFSDSAAVSEGDHENILESTLMVSATASLTLSPDGLIVEDGKVGDDGTRCCGLLQTTTKANSIPFYYILSAEFVRNTIKIKYVKPKSTKTNAPLRPLTLIYNVTLPQDVVRRWTDRLMENAYGSSQKYKRIKVLINPFGGKGRAQTIYNNQIGPVFEAAGCHVDLQQTTHRGHAVELARDLNIEDYDVLACASGDGLPMECFNGLGEKKNAREALRKIAIVQLPCGTGNAMSWNFNGTAEPSQATLAIIKGIRTPFDLASVTQGDKRTLSFLSQSLGIVAESDLGTDNLRWMGDFRFTYGYLARVFGKTLYPIDYAVCTELETKDAIKTHYAQEMSVRKSTQADLMASTQGPTDTMGLPPLKHGTINDALPKGDDSGWTPLEPYPNMGTFYVGNMCWMAADTPFFAASLPNDGLLDLVTIDGDISRTAAIKLVFTIGNGTLFDQDNVRVRKVSAVRVIPRFGRPMAEATAQDQPADSPPPSKPGVFQRLLARVSGSTGKKGWFSVDGEDMPWEPFQIEIHRGLGTVLGRSPGVYQYIGPRGWQDIQLPSADAAESAA